MKEINNCKIGVVGLGYVGLPLAVEFGKTLPTIGLDTNKDRITELKAGQDSSLETTKEELVAAKQLQYTCDPGELKQCDVYIVTVATPVDVSKRPDLSFLENACKMLGKLLGSGDIVIFESTVYPGATEEICVPILEQESSLKFNQDFYVGYSPERINPGDKEHRLVSIRKVTAGSTPEAADFVDVLYSHIITAGTYKTTSIKVAEAAKVIENTQRDVNIALINELSLLFNRLGIDTQEVLEAAGSKWNFLPFRPGLVGGHCIGVDPYYLTHKAQAIGYHPEIILAGRRINDGMGAYVVGQVVKLMIQSSLPVAGGQVLIMGLTFKENCPDLRNTRVVDMIDEFKSYGILPDVYDPWIDVNEAQREYGISPVAKLEKSRYDAIIMAVSHRQFLEMGIDAIRALGKSNHILYDIKYIFRADQVEGRL